MLHCVWGCNCGVIIADGGKLRIECLLRVVDMLEEGLVGVG